MDRNDFSVKIKPRKRYKANVRVIKKGKYRPKVYFDCYDWKEAQQRTIDPTRTIVLLKTAK